MSNKIIAIDLGTGQSCVAVMENGQPKVIINEEGERTTPSIVSYNKDEIAVGNAAKRQAVSNNKNTVFAAKRLMGNRYEDLDSIEKNFPYTVRAGKNGMATIDINGKEIMPQEIGAKILKKLKNAAEDYLGHEVDRLVLTVPAFFNDAQRQATKEAGEIAGFKVERIVAEPTAGALAFGLGKSKEKSGVYVVYDFGSGTFDCSILDIDDSVIETLSTSGDVHLGGTDLDAEIIKWIADEFKKAEGIDLLKDLMAVSRLKDAAEKGKIELSTMPSTTFNIPFITADAHGPKHLQTTLSRAQFEKMIAPYIEKTLESCKKALNDAGKKVEDIKEVLFVGGSTRIPLVSTMVAKFFGKEPNKSLNPDEAVALGAAVQAGILAGEVKDLLLLDVCPLTLSIETMGGVSTPIIDRNTTIPTRKSQIFSTASDGQTSVECVVLQGERKFAKDNMLLGRFHLDGIPPAPRGVPQIEVTYDVDANGILHVHAQDKATGKEQKITITASNTLSKEEIARMQNDAERYAEEDKKKLDNLTTRNSAETLIHSVEKTIADAGDKIADTAKADVQKCLDELKQLLSGEDYEKIKSGHDKLMQASFKLSEELYKNVDATPQSSPPPQTQNNSDVIEGEIVG